MLEIIEKVTEHYQKESLRDVGFGEEDIFNIGHEHDHATDDYIEKEMEVVLRRVDSNNPVVTITKKEYESLKKDRDFLNHLHAQGVDNWEGYSSPDSDEEEED